MRVVIFIMVLSAGAAFYPTRASAQTTTPGYAAFGGSSSASLTANSVCPLNGGVCSSTLTTKIGLRVPFGMTLRNLVATQSSAPTSNSSCSLVVRTSTACTANYVSTGLSCSITPSSGLTCSNASAQVPVNAGDCVQIQFVEVGSCSGFVTFGVSGAYVF